MICNMRDLGGMKTKDGKIIRPGMLMRSAQLSEAEGDDLKGVSEVIDLRTPKERLEAPDQTWYSSYSPMPIFETIMPGISHEDELTGRSIPDMTKLYEKLMKECADTFRDVLLEIMNHDYDSGAVLWHCTEGKDRCGMTSALVLEMLGVSREFIMEDYLKTNLINLPKARKIQQQAAAIYGEEFAEGVYQAYIADERYLRAAWEAMGENYIRDTLKIDEEKIAEFREKILTT